MNCDQCNFTTSSLEDLDIHKQVKHKSTKVNIDIQDQIVIKCDKCDYKCRLNIQLRKHMEKHHKEEELKYKCDLCNFASNYLLHAWEHRQSNHPEKAPEFAPRSSKDMVLSMLAEQNIDIIEGLETLRADTKNSSVEFAAIMESCFLAVSDDIK